MSIEQTAIDQADFDEMSMIAEQHTKKEDNVTCSDVRELREARLRIVELEAHCEFYRSELQYFLDRVNNGTIRSVKTTLRYSEALEQTPQQSLAEIQAKAVEDAANRFREKSIARDVLMSHADQLRAKAK